MKNNFIYYLLFIPFLFILPNEGISFQIDNFSSDQKRLAKIDEYLAVAKEKLKSDIPASFAAAQNAKELSQGFDEQKNISAELNISHAYQLKGKIDTSLLIAKATLARAKNISNDTLLAEVYHVLGTSYQCAGSIELAIESYHNALQINERLGLDKVSLKQLNNIGLLYREEGEYDLALEYLNKCLDQSRVKGYKLTEFYSYANIGYILMKQNKWEEALIRFNKTLKFGEYVQDKTAFCTIHYLIADVKLQQGKLATATAFAQKALKIANESEFALGKVFSQRVLSDIYRQQKKYTLARTLANKTLNYMNENSIKLYVEDILDVLYDIEYDTGNYKRALDIQLQISARRDSLNEIRSKEKIANSEYKFQLLENEQENQLLKIQNESSKRISSLAILVAILLFLVVMLALFAYTKSKNYNQTLETAIEERTKELALSNQYLAKSNEELERFAYIASHDL
ncbi:MAG: tetratricopeptide repeat protein, partial [Saprospiraceae bacterium]